MFDRLFPHPLVLPTLVLAAALLPSTVAVAQLPAGHPIAVNSTADSDVESDTAPTVTVDAAAWIAAWVSDNDLGGTLGTDRDILFARSLDQGATWSPAAALNFYADVDEPGINAEDYGPVLASAGGTTIAVWVNRDHFGIGSDRDLVFARSTDAGVTWSEAALLSPDFASDAGDDAEASIAGDGAGTWVVVWHSDDPRGADNLGTDRDILVSRSIDDGLTWSSPAALHASAMGDVDPDDFARVATDGGSTWVVVWHREDDLSGEADILFVRSVDDGASWTSPAPLDAATAAALSNENRPEIACDGGTGWVVLFQAEPDTTVQVLALRSTDGGASWGGAVVVGTIPQNRTPVASFGPGSFIATFGQPDLGRGGAGGESDVVTSVSTDGGATWTDPSPVHDTASTDLGTDVDPALAVDRNGRVMVVWRSDEDLDGVLGTDTDILTVTGFPQPLLFADGFESGDFSAWAP